MEFTTFISIAGTILGILGTLFVGAIWVLTLTSRISNRAYSLERDMESGKDRLTKLENKTSFEYLETISQRAFSNLIHSEEFKKVTSQVIKDTLLHIEKNRTASSLAAFEEILAQIRELRESR